MTFRSPKDDTFTAAMDDLLAATGASPGHLNPVFEVVKAEEDVEFELSHKPSARVIKY